MKKLLILTNADSGLYIFRRELIQALSEHYSVSCCVPGDNGYVEKLEALGCACRILPFDRRGINPRKDLHLLLAYRALLKAEKPDVVVTYTIKPNTYGGLLCRMRRIPYATNITGLGTAFETGGLLKKLVIFLYRFSLRRAGAVFFENTADRDTFLEHHIIRETQAKVLHGAGVNLDRFQYAPYPEDGECFRFLFIGRIMKEKGVNELFDAVRRLASEGKQCTLDVLGRYEEHYQSLVRQCECEGWLRYQGFQTDVRPFVAASHCFVLPSWHEGMANTNLECAASGRPVITSDIPGCREAVIDGVSGMLCQPKNAESLYRSMKKMMEMDHAQREAMGRAGRRHMEEVFDKRSVVKETIARINEGASE